MRIQAKTLLFLAASLWVFGAAASENYQIKSVFKAPDSEELFLVAAQLPAIMKASCVGNRKSQLALQISKGSATVFNPTTAQTYYKKSKSFSRCLSKMRILQEASVSPVNISIDGTGFQIN